MEKILITFSPDGKSVAQKIQQSLKASGYSSTLGATRVDQDPILPEVVIAVITNDSILNGTMINVLNGCSEKCVSVVPFVTVKLASSITTNFFLDEHVWIDNIACPFDQSVGDLVDCLQNNYSELAKKTVKKSASAKKSSANKKSQKADSKQKNDAPVNGKLYKNLFYLSLAAIAMLLFILMNGGDKQLNREAANQQANSQNSKSNADQQIKVQLSNDLKRSETSLVGRWKMVSYTDNQYRATRADSLALQSMIDALVNRAQLIFNADKSFQRIGFSQNTESGVWEYDPQSHYLKLQPTGVNQYDVVQIQDLTDSQFVIVVSEKVEDQSMQVMTRMVFQKVANQ